MRIYAYNFSIIDDMCTCHDRDVWWRSSATWSPPRCEVLNHLLWWEMYMCVCSICACVSNAAPWSASRCRMSYHLLCWEMFMCVQYKSMFVWCNLKPAKMHCVESFAMLRKLCVCLCVCVCVHVCARIYIYIYTYIHTYIHTHTHTQIQVLAAGTDKVELVTPPEGAKVCVASHVHSSLIASLLPCVFKPASYCHSQQNWGSVSGFSTILHE